MNKKFIVAASIMVFGCSLTGCGNTGSNSTTTEIQTTTKANDIQTNQSIKGSDANTVAQSVSFQYMNSKAPSIKDTKNGCEIECFSDAYNCLVTTDADTFEVSSAEFRVMGNSDKTSFLAYCASFEYDGATEKKTYDWVKKNTGKNISKTFGNATFTLEKRDNCLVLTVTAS